MNGSHVRVLIAGAGPVGLLLANLLGARGLECLLVDKRMRPSRGSRAIGVTPPSLGILGALGLDNVVADRGVRITRARVHDDRREIGHLDFDALPSPHRFILAVPQACVMQILADALQRYPSVHFRRGVELVGVHEADGNVRCTLRDHTTGCEETQAVRVLVGCDGNESTTRRLVRIACTRKPYKPHFVMADTERVDGLADDAHLYFTAIGSVEAFPLPDGCRRWVALASENTEDEIGVLSRRIARIAGVDLRNVRHYMHGSFTPERLLARRYHRGGVVLCGDAAHVMSPIGGQGMNTGFADAEFLGAILPSALGDADSRKRLFALYERYRKKAFKVAARRAALGMWIGTRTGSAVSSLRSLALRGVVLKSPVRQRLPSLFAMLTIPHNRVCQVPLKLTDDT